LTQNIYDNQKFFEKYQRLPRSLQGLAGAPEWPALRALLPALGGLRVLDLGCGFGWFSRWARQNGASRVLGIDVSRKMLTRARAETHDPAINYLRADLDRLRLQSSSFDLVFSSLGLHYVKNLGGLISKFRRSLV
jgi:ubiquinone/menaquinone biosynthesis C-methylase UbiE